MGNILKTCKEVHVRYINFIDNIILLQSPQVCSMVSITACSVRSSCNTSAALIVEQNITLHNENINSSIVSAYFDLEPNQLYTVHANVLYAQVNISTDTINLSKSYHINVVGGSVYLFSCQ